MSLVIASRASFAHYSRIGKEKVMQLTQKRQGMGMEMRTFAGRSGATYLVFKTGPASYHVFAEVEAKEAARDCGVEEGSNTRTEWGKLWYQPAEAA
jgi:hypothetical protein